MLLQTLENSIGLKRSSPACLPRPLAFTLIISSVISPFASSGRAAKPASSHARTVSYCATDISRPKANCSTTRTGSPWPQDYPQPRSIPSLTPVRINRKWPSRPIFCPSHTTFWTTFPSRRTSAEVEPSPEMLIPPKIPLPVPLAVPHKHLKVQEQPREHQQQCGHGKKRFVAGNEPLIYRHYL